MALVFLTNYKITAIQCSGPGSTYEFKVTLDNHKDNHLTVLATTTRCTIISSELTGILPFI